MAEQLATSKKRSPKKVNTSSIVEEIAQPLNKEARVKTLVSGMAFNAKTYELSTAFKAATPGNALEAHTTQEMAECLKKDSKIEISGSYLSMNGDGVMKRQRITSTKNFMERYDKGAQVFKGRTFKENWNGSVGEDFVPLLGGPFHKQLYMHDYLRMNAASFFAYNHDPMARRAVEIIVDFTLGRGFKIECENKSALALIRAFEEVNSLYEFMKYGATELSIYGEIMPWELPGGQTKIGFDLAKGQEVPTGILPRWRLIDPSCIWEIVTYPEDITRKLFYQWTAPTQYQNTTGSDGGSPVPSTKFIFQQIPAQEVLHYKINSVSNEKRGRSDLFPALGYMKRLRDSVDYSLISLQKQSAWSIDTTIEGGQADIDAYVRDQEAAGTIAPPGSEFIHTKAVARTYLSNQAGRAGSSEAFDWALSMIAASTGVPIQYFGTHLSNSGTRASALVATEPIAKRFEMRQRLYEDCLRQMIRRLFTKFNISADEEFDIIFPEIITQDRSAKIKDIAAAQANGWISRQRAAEIVAKELGIAKYDYSKEADLIKVESQDNITNMASTNPLTTPGLKNETVTRDTSGSAITSDEKSEVTQNGRNL